MRTTVPQLVSQPLAKENKEATPLRHRAITFGVPTVPPSKSHQSGMTSDATHSREAEPSFRDPFQGDERDDTRSLNRTPTQMLHPYFTFPLLVGRNSVSRPLLR